MYIFFLTIPYFLPLFAIGFVALGFLWRWWLLMPAAIAAAIFGKVQYDGDMIRLSSFFEVADILFTRRGQIFAGYVAGSFVSAIVVLLFLTGLSARDNIGLMLFVIMVGFVMALYAITLPLIVFVVFAEVTCTSNILYYMFT